MFKKGISTIIGIVLIILLVIGGVFIIWGSINPVIEESSDIEIDRNDLIIVSEQGYTVYEPKDPNDPGDVDEFCVQVRNIGENEIEEMFFHLSLDDGNVVSKVAEPPSTGSTKSYCYTWEEEASLKSVRISTSSSGGGRSFQLQSSEVAFRIGEINDEELSGNFVTDGEEVVEVFQLKCEDCYICSDPDFDDRFTRGNTEISYTSYSTSYEIYGNGEKQIIGDKCVSVNNYKEVTEVSDEGFSVVIVEECLPENEFNNFYHLILTGENIILEVGQCQPNSYVDSESCSGPNCYVSETVCYDDYPGNYGFCVIDNNMCSSVYFFTGGILLRCPNGCIDGACLPEVNGPICGDGDVSELEQCDDGDIVDGDGCSSTCTIESVETPLVMDCSIGKTGNYVCIDNVIGRVGKNFLIPVRVSAQDTEGVNIFLSYDETKLEITSDLILGNVGSSFGLPIQNINNLGRIVFTAANVEKVSMQGILFYINGTITSDGINNIRFSEVSFDEVAFSPIYNGTISNPSS